MPDTSAITKIVGVAGLPRSGKDTLAELFVENGYYGVSLGDIVRDASRIRHADSPDPISVANMTETSNWLRGEKGADFALKEAFERFDKSTGEGNSYKGLIVWSIRAPAEVDFILDHNGQLIWLESSDNKRLERAQRDRRPGEPEWTLENLKAQEALQWVPQPNIPEESQMNISYVKSKATLVYSNDSDSIDAFKEDAKKLVKSL
jgi:hypothetical protein